MTGVLAIGLASWIVQDGNYTDFVRGYRSAFALEFYSPTGLNGVEPPSHRMVSLSYVGGAHYDAVGRVVYAVEDWWVIDVGVLVFRAETPPPDARPGRWMQGKIYIGVDPFFYFERLALKPAAPALIYDWEIERIELETGPFIEVDPPENWHPSLRKSPVMLRDPARLEYTEVSQTNAWRDDAGNASYILHCKRLEGPARRTLR